MGYMSHTLLNFTIFLFQERIMVEVSKDESYLSVLVWGATHWPVAEEF
jgi:hypothetical protein